MAQSADVEAFRGAQRDVVALAHRDLLRLWRGLDLDDPIAAVRELEAYLPDLVAAHGEIGAAVAADFYDEIRAQNPRIGRAYTAVLADATPIAKVRASTRWAVGPLFGRGANPGPGQALDNVLGITDRLVKGQARATIGLNTRRDPARPRYARVPVGETCAFCLVLASRGAVYYSEDTAGRDWHDWCNCEPTPIWEGDAYPGGYDPDKLKATYEAARDAAKTGQLKGDGGILAALREREGIA